MNDNDDIVARLRGSLPADGTLNTDTERLCAHAAAVIEMLRGEMATMHRTVVHKCCTDKQIAEADADRLAHMLYRYAIRSDIAHEAGITDALAAHDEAVRNRGGVGLKPGDRLELRGRRS